MDGDTLLEKAHANNAPGFVHDHHHFVIAVTCPFAPFFEVEERNGKGVEWEYITKAFSEFHLVAQPVFLHYDEALSAFSADIVESVWLCGGMKRPDNGYFISYPLLPREFIAVSLEQRALAINGIEDLVKLKTGIHPDVLLALGQNLSQEVLSNAELTQISNHVLLEAMLFSGSLDAIIMEKTVFAYYRQQVPSMANPEQPVAIHPIFQPVYPVLVFKDKDVRDKFNASWQALTDQVPMK